MKHKLKQGSAFSLLPAGTELPTTAFHLALTSSPPARAHLIKRKMRLREAELTSIVTQRSRPKPHVKGAQLAAFPATALTRSLAFRTLLLPLSSVSWGLFLALLKDPPHAGWLPHIQSLSLVPAMSEPAPCLVQGTERKSRTWSVPCGAHSLVSVQQHDKFNNRRRRSTKEWR